MGKFFRNTYTLVEINVDASWILIFLGALHLMMGLMQAILSQMIGVGFIVIGVAFIALAYTQWFWIRYLVILVWTLSLFIDLALRSSIMAIFFIFVGIHYLIYLVKFGRQSQEDSS